VLSKLRGGQTLPDRLVAALATPPETTTDDHLVALDAKAGKVAWDQKVQDYKKGQCMTFMPLVMSGKVLVGGSGGEYGVRGYVVAYDANDGKELWRTCRNHPRW
jgi:outer membrane protein assembly factor BamB